MGTGPNIHQGHADSWIRWVDNAGAIVRASAVFKPTYLRAEEELKQIAASGCISSRCSL